MRWPRADRVAIIASGPSAGRLDVSLLANTTVICVNGSITWAHSVADYWFSLDPSPVNMIRCANRVHGVRYVLCAPSNYETDPQVLRPTRVSGDLYQRARAPGGMSEQHDRIHTGNSAFGALNLAYHMRPKRIALFGVDGSSAERIEGGKPRTFQHLPELFATAIPQLVSAGIEVVNGSPMSRVDCFRRTNPEEAARWVTKH